jgi:DNA-binding transcriptional ArsR family regulator
MWCIQMRDHLSQTFAALADPTRRAMLARLTKGEANVSELAEPFLKHMSLPAITKHLKVLERAGLISKTREAQWRPCKLKEDAFQDVADWMEPFSMFWEESLDRLDAYLKTVTANTTATANTSGKGTSKDKAKGKSRGRKK